MKYRKGQITLFLISILLGFTISILIYHNSGNIKESPSIEQIRNLLDEEKNAQEIRDNYLARIAELEGKINGYQNQATQYSAGAQNIQNELNKVRVLAGLVDLEGPGVEIVLNDRKKETLPAIDGYSDINWYLVHDEDVLRVVNELSAAGAEAISINDTRIISNTRIRCGGPTINVKDRPLAPPYIIKAIGDPDALQAFITNPPAQGFSSISIFQELTSYGIEFKITKEQHLKIPRYYGTLRFTYAKPIQESEGE